MDLLLSKKLVFLLVKNNAKNKSWGARGPYQMISHKQKKWAGCYHRKVILMTKLEKIDFLTMGS